MACNYCHGPFCLFRLEKRCPSCGFSYCVKCLDNKIFVKQLKTNKKVCVKCAQFNSSGEVHMIPPPDYYRKTSLGGTKTSELKFGENDDNRTRPQNNNPRRWNERGLNAFNRNRYEPDQNLPSTSRNHNGIVYRIAKRASDSESENDEDYSGDLSEEWDDEPNDQNLELKRSLSPDLKDTHPHLYHKTQRVERDTRSTDEILREAIKQLKEGFGDNGDKSETLNKNPPKCVLCSTEAVAHCQGCKSIFCQRCFDMHSDEVCATYEILKPHGLN